jgi:hypothetical protein
MPYLLCATYQIELPEVKVASNGKVHYNALPPLWHLPSRIARSEGCLKWGSTLTPYLLCGTCLVELPGRKSCLEWGSTVH